MASARLRNKLKAKEEGSDAILRARHRGASEKPRNREDVKKAGSIGGKITKRSYCKAVCRNEDYQQITNVRDECQRARIPTILPHFEVEIYCCDGSGRSAAPCRPATPTTSTLRRTVRPSENKIKDS